MVNLHNFSTYVHHLPTAVKKFKAPKWWRVSLCSYFITLEANTSSDSARSKRFRIFQGFLDWAKDNFIPSYPPTSPTASSTGWQCKENNTAREVFTDRNYTQHEHLNPVCRRSRIMSWILGLLVSTRELKVDKDAHKQLIANKTLDQEP